MVFDPLVEHVRADLRSTNSKGTGTDHLLPVELLAAGIPARLALHHQVSIGRDVLDKLRSRLLEVKDDRVIINDLYPLLDFLRHLLRGVVLYQSP